MADKAPDRLETLAHVRAMYPAYQDMPDLELGNALAEKYPQYAFLKTEAPRGEGDKVVPPSDPTDVQSMAAKVYGAGQPKDLNIIQKVGNVLLPPLVTAPAIAAGGEVLPAAPAIGRALASGALGGAKAATSGKGPGGIVWDAVVDTLVGGASEVGGALAGAVKIPKIGWKTSLAEKATKVPRTIAGREAGSRELKEAGDLIASRLPKSASLNVPALSAQPLTIQEAVAGLKKLNDPQFTIARQQLIAALNANDKAMIAQGVKPLTRPYSGQIFGHFSPRERFTYRGTPTEKALAGTLPFVPGARAGLEAEATAEGVPGIPNALLPILGAVEGTTFGDLARHVKPSP